MTSPEINPYQDDASSGMYAWAISLASRSDKRITATHQPSETDLIYQDLDTIFYPGKLAISRTKGRKEELERVNTRLDNWSINEASRLYSTHSFYNSVMQLRSQGRLLDELKQATDHNLNIAHITNHPNLISPIIDKVAVNAAMGDADFSSRGNIIANKALAWLSFELGPPDAPVTMNPLEISTNIANVYAGIPDSSSTAEYGLKDYSGAANGKMLRALVSDLKHSPGGTTTFAGSGSLDILGPTGITMKRASNVSASLLARHFKYVFYTCSWIDPVSREYHLAASDQLIPVQGEDSLHSLMRQMEEPYKDLVKASLKKDIPVKYDHPASGIGQIAINS